MRTNTLSRARRDRIVLPQRRAFLAECRLCWFCPRLAEVVHEIAKGCHRPLAFADPIAWAAACWRCNDGPLNDYAEWPLARQMAMKRIHDPGRYDLAAFNRLRGTAEETAITEAEVNFYVEQWRRTPALPWMEA